MTKMSADEQLRVATARRSARLLIERRRWAERARPELPRVLEKAAEIADAERVEGIVNGDPATMADLLRIAAEEIRKMAEEIGALEARVEALIWQPDDLER